MKINLIISFFLFPIFLKSQIKLVENFGHNPGNLKMYVYKPKKIHGNSPMVLALHGCSQNASSFSKQTGWNYLADSLGFYVVYPKTELFNNPSLCYNWFRKKDINKTEGECASIYEMVRYMETNFKIDTQKVFVMGVSAGAAMANVLLANYPDKFAAGAILAGGAFKSATSFTGAAESMAGWVKKNPEEWGKLVQEENPHYSGEYPKTIIMHGQSDNVVNPKSSHEIMKQWAWLHQTDTLPHSVEQNFDNHPQVVKEVYADKNEEVKIVYYKIASVGHSLPVDSSRMHAVADNKLFTKNIGWSVIKAIAEDFGLLSD